MRPYCTVLCLTSSVLVAGGVGSSLLLAKFCDPTGNLCELVLVEMSETPNVVSSLSTVITSVQQVFYILTKSNNNNNNNTTTTSWSVVEVIQTFCDGITAKKKYFGVFGIFASLTLASDLSRSNVTWQLRCSRTF